MNKELTELEWLRYYERIVRESNQTFRPNGFGIIETTLKNHNQLQIDYDEMDRINDELNLSNHQLSDENIKLKKALEIIKNKLLAGCFTDQDSYSNYAMAMLMSGNEELKKNMMTEQEYNLLKEILNNG